MLADDLDLSTKEEVLPQGTLVRNRKTLSLTIQKLWPMLKVFFFFCGKKNKQIGQKLSMYGQKKLLKIILWFYDLYKRVTKYDRCHTKG